jgi:hypothetical protein
MIGTFLIAFAVFVVALIGMAIGVIVSNRRLKGSCGGLAGLRDEHGNPLCHGCSLPSADCRGVSAEPSTTTPASVSVGGRGDSCEAVEL